jgi:hypothetical protein
VPGRPLISAKVLCCLEAITSLRQTRIVVNYGIKDRLIDAADIFLDLGAFNPRGARVPKQLLGQFGNGDDVRTDSLRNLGPDAVIEEVRGARAHAN